MSAYAVIKKDPNNDYNNDHLAHAHDSFQQSLAKFSARDALHLLYVKSNHIYIYNAK